MEGAYINIKLIIGNRESGTGNWFLVPHLRKRLGYFNLLYGKRGIRNREREISSLFWYIRLMFQKCKSGIRNQFPVPF